MDRPPESQPFPLSRFMYIENGTPYYAYGNTVVEDFLQSVTNQCNPTILSLGCGDIRSCFYTLWKNFESPGKSSFTGVHFFLNDLSAPILARNIIFLYLCLTMPDSTARTQYREWIASMWSIWYNHELTSQHEQALMDALAQLIKWSETPQQWSACELGVIVKFTSVATVEAVRQVWVLWRDRRVKVASVAAMRSLRVEFQKRNTTMGTRNERIRSYAYTSILHLGHFLGHTHNEFSKECIDTMVEEFAAYSESGTIFAEQVMDLPITTDQATVNMTLFERADGSYTLCHSSIPYVAFPQCIHYSPSLVALATQQSKPASRGTQLVVPEKHFVQTPLLANSVQQFAMWLSAAAKVIKQCHSAGSIGLLFTLHCGDAINLCQTLLHHPDRYSHGLGPSPLFDAIYTSNLFDHLPPPALVLTSASLLKPGALLFTTTINMRYSEGFFTSSEYLEMFFGFSPELFPVLLGIRCIGHDGQYSSSISPQPNPSQITDLGTRIQDPKLLVWQNIISDHLSINSLKASDVLTRALLKCCVAACVHPFMLKMAHVMINRLSPESFIVVLHRFVSQLHPDTCTSYQFWEPLCKMMLEEEALKPHLLQLQTLSLLSGLHMHITVSQLDCPFCSKQPVLDYLRRYSVSFVVNSESKTPMFAVHIKTGVDTTACITSFTGSVNGHNLRLDFLLPKLIGQSNPVFTLYEYHVAVGIAGKMVVSDLLLSGTLPDAGLSVDQYFFTKFSSRAETLKHQQTMGEILEHMGDSGNFKTVISVSDACAIASKSSSLKTTQDHNSEVQLHCGNGFKMTIHYPYPIDLTKVKVRLSNQSRTITVKATRAASFFYTESPVFLIDPNKRMAFPPVDFSSKTIEHYCQTQLTMQDIELHLTPKPPHCILKEFLNGLLSYARNKERFITLEFPSQDREQILIAIHDILIDFRFNSPVLDVSYCFLDSIFKQEHRFSIVQQWQEIVKETGQKGVLKLGDTYINMNEIIKRVFAYFASQTCNTEISRENVGLSILKRFKINSHFKRCALYLMYPDTDVERHEMYKKMKEVFVTKMLASAAGIPLNEEAIASKADCCSTTISSTMENLTEKSYCSSKSTKNVCSPKCSQCGRASTSLSSCPCHQAAYCSEACQRLDWPQHRSICTKSGSLSPEPKHILEDSTVSLCSQCRKFAIPLKQCPCHEAAYCSMACQRLHWPQHKSKCTKSGHVNPKLKHEPQDSKASDIILCSRCRKSNDPLKRCPCHKAAYCSLECRRLDWPQHKSICSRSGCMNPKEKQDSEASDTNSCSQCGKFDIPLKWCPCHRAAYCSVKCQRLDWPQHKSLCTASKKTQA